MSAGFKVAGDVFWGTSGAIEAYVEVMAAAATARFGAGDTLAQYLAEQRDNAATGQVLYLDEWLVAPAGRERFLTLLDAATERLLREEAFTDYGREWVSSVVAELRARIATGGRAEPGAAPNPASG